MALIKCPECNADVSDRADECVNCGCPIAKQPDGPALSSPALDDFELDESKPTRSFWKKLTIPSIVVAVFIAIVAANIFLKEKERHDLKALEQKEQQELERLEENIGTWVKEDYITKHNKDINILKVGLIKKTKDSYEYTGFIDASYRGKEKQLSITVTVNGDNVMWVIKAPVDPWAFDIW